MNWGYSLEEYSFEVESASYEVTEYLSLDPDCSNKICTNPVRDEMHGPL